jgi:hypothetical protein
MNNGEPTVPNFKAFVNKLQIAGLRIKFAVLGRDQNIVQMQQTRVRGAPTLERENIQQQLGFPIATADPRIKDILAEDANSKYFVPIAHHPTDDLARHSSRKHT